MRRHLPDDHALQTKLSPNSFGAYFLVLLLLMNSSQVFLANYQDELLAVSTVIAMLAMYLYRKIPSPRYLLFLFSLLLWVGYISIQYEVWNLNTAIGFFCRFFLAYAIVAVLRDKFLYVFVDVIYRLAIISLLFYFVGLVFPAVMQQLHLFFNLMPDFFIVDLGEYRGWITSNFLFYTFSVQRLEQNHGFMWEPTAFAVVVMLAMMLHLGMNKFKLDKRFSVLLTALITTFSTTGILAFSIVITFYLLNNNARYKKIRSYYVPLGGVFLIIFAIFISQMEIFGGKVQSEIERWDEVAIKTDLTMSGNSRLSSFIFDVSDWIDHPLLGIGIFEENRYRGVQQLGSVNGIGDTLVRFGAVFSLVFLFNFMRSFKLFCNTYRIKGFGLFVLLIMIFSWSERLTILPLFLAFQFYYLPFYSKKKISIRHESNCNLRRRFI